MVIALNRSEKILGLLGNTHTHTHQTLYAHIHIYTHIYFILYMIKMYDWLYNKFHEINMYLWIESFRGGQKWEVKIICEAQVLGWGNWIAIQEGAIMEMTKFFDTPPNKKWGLQRRETRLEAPTVWWLLRLNQNHSSMAVHWDRKDIEKHWKAIWKTCNQVKTRNISF